MVESGVEIHYFAAARAARGEDHEVLEITDGTDSLGSLIDALGTEHTRLTAAGMTLSEVFDRCTFLVDGRNVSRETSASVPLAGVTRIDVLPPFAGG